MFIDDDPATKTQSALGDFVAVLLALSVLASGAVVGGYL
jgi:hypothetical protein